MSNNKTFLVEKAISIPIVIALIFLLTPAQVLTMFIVLGQAHFFIAYLYQYRAGKISARYATLYAIVLAICLTTLLYFERLDLLIVASGIIFLTHFLQDEVFLIGKRATRFTLLEMLPVLLLYTGFLLSSIMRIRLMPELVTLATAVIVLFVIASIWNRRAPDSISVYFLGISALLLYLYHFKVYVPIEILLGTLVLLHYSSWYIAYYFKVRNDAFRRASYLKAVASCNLLAVGLYAFFLTPAGSWLFVLFAPGFFYTWTLMHTLFSIRWNDWKNSLVG
jgi:hypothetical protein